MNATPRTLQQMHRRPTSYEVVAVTDKGQSHRLGFTARRTKGALLSMAQANGSFLLSLLGDWDDVAIYSRDTGWTFGPVRIRFSGATERDCA